MDNTSPVQGDERWYPVYWSTKKNPTTEQQIQPGELVLVKVLKTVQAIIFIFPEKTGL